MSESDFYTVNSRCKARGEVAEWPAWELQGHGSAAPAPEPAADDDPAGTPGPGSSSCRLDPLGPWFSARLTFDDGARIDVLVTVSDDGRITVEDMRADPPLTLDGLAALARWIEGPLDDACRTATGRPLRDQPPGRGEGLEPGEPGESAGLEPGAAPGSVTPADAGTTTATVTDTDAELVVPRMGDAEEVTARSADEEAVAPAGGVVHGDGVLCGVLTGPAEPPSGHDPENGPGRAPQNDPGCDAGNTPGNAPEPSPAAHPLDGATASPESSAAAPDGSAPPPAPAPSALLTRSRAGERRKFAADVYREAQREGRDPVLAVMNATGRNRRRSLRLIAGARDDGLLTPRHNKR